MNGATIDRLKTAVLKSLFFTVIVFIIRVAFDYADEEVENILSDKNLLFGALLFLFMSGIYYFTDKKNPTWSDIFNKFKRKQP